MTVIERRFTRVQLRDDSGSRNGMIFGRAAAFNKLSLDLGGFRERLLPGCFRKTLTSPASDDLYLCQDHNPTLIVGRVKAGNLSVSEDANGLNFSCALPATTHAQDLRELVRQGIVSECSFAFVVPDGCDDWDDEECDPENDFPDFDSSMRTRSGKVRCKIRTVREVHPLIDISCVTSPAYAGSTAANARTFFPEGVPISVRSHMRDEDAVLSFQRQQRRLMIGRAQ